MSYLLPIAALLLATGLISVLLKARFVVALPIALMSIGLILYLFYIAGMLHVGFVVVISAIGIGAVIYLVRLARLRLLRLLFWRVCTPQLVTFGLICVVSYLATRESTVTLWDELRLWGAYPKILYDSGSLQLGSGAELFPLMQWYTPGMPLTAYFFTAFSPTFHEPMLFFAYAITAAVFLIPISGVITWRRFSLIPLAALIIVGVAMYFWNSNNDDGNFFGTLFIDPYLGLISGYGCYLIATGAVHRRPGVVAIALTAATLYLFKDTGLLFGAVLIAASVLQIALARRALVPTTTRLAKLLAVRTVVLAAPLIFVVVSWRILLAAYRIRPDLGSNYFDIQVTWRNLGNFAGALLSRGLVAPGLTLTNWPAYVLVAAGFVVLCAGLFSALATRTGFSVFRVRGDRSVLMISALLVVAGCGLVFAFSFGAGGVFSYSVAAALTGLISLGVLARVKSDSTGPREFRNLAIAVVATAVLNLLFIVGLYALTEVAFAGVLESFERYMCTVCTLNLTFLVLFLTSRRWTLPKPGTAVLATTAIATALSVLVFLFPFRETVQFDGGWNTSAARTSASVLRQVSADAGRRASSETRVFLVFTDVPWKIEGLHHRIYFDLLGTGVVVRNFYDESRITTSLTPSDSRYRSSVLAAQTKFERQLVQEDDEYVYVAHDSAALKSQFGGVFPGGVTRDGLYRVSRSGTGVKLTRVS